MFSTIYYLLLAGLVSSDAFNISLELMGNCSPAFTLVCRHDEKRENPSWIHNDTTVKFGGTVLEAAFPGRMYSVSTKTEHRATVGNNTAEYDGYRILCIYNLLHDTLKCFFFLL